MTTAIVSFGIIDYCVFAAVLLISILIGGYLSLKGSKSPDEYLLGNRQLSPLSISISMVTSYVSAISLIGVIGELYAHGSQIIWILLGTVLGIIAVGIIFLPVFHPLKLTSVNEYIQMRFQSPFLTTCMLLLNCVRTLLYAGLCLYAPTIALVAVSPFDYMTYIILLGVICTLYSALGGIRAVVWTDVFQFFFMIVGLIVILILGYIELGGFGKAWTIASKGERLNIFTTETSIYVRHTVYNLILSGFVNAAATYGVDQIYVQRLCSVSSLRNAKKVLLNTIIGYLFVYILLFAGGILVYSIYVGCDPMAQGLINRKEGIFPYLILDRLSYVTGLPGLFVATLIGGTLSSVSSVINAVGALLWKDVLCKITFFKDGSSSLAVVANKFLCLVTGCICIGTAMLFSKAGGLTQAVLTLMGIFAGPFFAVFLLGVFFPRCNSKGVFAGLLVSFLFVGWISVGAQLYAAKPATLPLSTEKCNITSEFYANKTSALFNGTKAVVQNYTQLTNQETTENDFNLMWLYDISYALYSSIGFISCLITAVIVSYITGWQNLNEIPPECISSPVRKYYWPENHKIFHKHHEEEYKDINEKPQTETKL